MRKLRLSKEECEIESDLLKGEYVDIDKSEFKKIADSIAARKKDAVLNIRINSEDLKRLKKKAEQLDVKYQTFVSEILHRVAQS